MFAHTCFLSTCVIATKIILKLVIIIISLHLLTHVFMIIQKKYSQTSDHHYLSACSTCFDTCLHLTTYYLPAYLLFADRCVGFKTICSFTGLVILLLYSGSENQVHFGLENIATQSSH